MTALVFLDTETLGLNLSDPIWEIAAIRREADGTDVENLAVGWLAGRGADLPALPWDSDALSLAVGVDPDDFRRHEAMADVEWAMAIYDRIARKGHS